jgi:dipeptidyl aminopeptidase/acylaminoacyl peptidase
MMMRIARGIALIFIALTSMGLQAAQRPFSIDDYLSLEATGAGASRGALIVWEQAPPYDALKYYGHGHIGAWDGTGFTIKTIDLAASKPLARSLFEPEPGVSYWIDSISPDARYVALYGAREGAFFMAVFDTVNNHLTKFAQTPLVDWAQGRESVWISADEFVFSAYSEGMQPLGAARPYTGHRLAGEREKAWHGELSVEVETTGLDTGPKGMPLPGHLYKANAQTGEVRLLTEGKFESLNVSFDGRYLAALRQYERPPPAPGSANVDWVSTRSELVLLDLHSNYSLKTIASDKQVFIETLAWAPDSDRLAFFAWNKGTGAQTGIFYALDAHSGALTPYRHRGLDLVTERERGFAQKPERVMWIDGRLAVFARKSKGDQALLTYRDISRPGSQDTLEKPDWYLLDAHGRTENLSTRFKQISAIPLDADSHSLAVLADGHVWRIGPGRAPQDITASKDLWDLPLSVKWSTTHRQFTHETLLQGVDEKRPAFMLIDFRKDQGVRLESPAADAEYLAASVNNSAVLFRHHDEQGAELVLQRADGQRVSVARLNSHMAAVAKTTWRTIQYRVHSEKGDRDISSCMLLPADYEPGKRYPVIVDIYPGRGARCTEPSLQMYVGIGTRPGAYSEHLLAAKGYIVFKPNASAELIQTKDGPLGGMNAIVNQGLDALAEQGYADLSRVGLIGYSQGGFAALWLATQSERFKAVVSLNGWADMYSDYFESSYLEDFYAAQFGFGMEAIRYESTAGSDFPLGGKPYGNATPFVSNSPIFHTPRITAPILLIHSDMDVFSLGQYERMFTALHLEGKQAKFLRYWGEGHAPSSPQNIRHMWTEIFDWFEANLH